MNTKQFKYAVLKYRPSYWLDEQVNIGLLFLFPEDGRVEFLVPNRLRRLSQLYPGVRLSLIRQHLTAFRAQAADLRRRNLFVEATRDNLLETEFLVPDANALFFSEFKAGQYTDAAATLEHYRKAYFGVYDGEQAKTHKDESWIANRFVRALKQQGAEKEHLFRRKLRLENSFAHAEFDFAWQNGKLNLVKPLGFDLESPDSILDKSNLWLSKLNNLKPELEKGNHQVDLLLSEPGKSSVKNRRAFDNAVQLLEKLAVPKQIVPENQLEHYVEQAVNNVVLPA